MKKVNLIIIATIIATFAIAMFAFQTIKTEASNNVSPLASATPRKIRKMPRQTIEVENDETHRTPKTVAKGKTTIPSSVTRKTKVKPKKPNSFQEISGIGMEARKHPRRKSAQYNPKEVGIDKVVRRKASKNEVSIETLERRKNPRKRKN